MTPTLNSLYGSSKFGLVAPFKKNIGAFAYLYPLKEQMFLKGAVHKKTNVHRRNISINKKKKENRSKIVLSIRLVLSLLDKVPEVVLAWRALYNVRFIETYPHSYYDVKKKKPLITYHSNFLPKSSIKYSYTCSFKKIPFIKRANKQTCLYIGLFFP